MKHIILFFALIAIISSFNLKKQATINTALALNADPTECIKQKCPDQYAKCQADPKCPTTLQKCQSKCNTDTSCWKWCLVGAGDGPAEDVAKCAAANHCLGQEEPKVEEPKSTALALNADPT